MKKGHEKYTVFKTPYRMYEFRVVLFRLINASAKQQEHANNMLREGLFKFVIIYLDDILIYTKETQEDHIEKVK
jgi:hypothetical protein